MRIAVITDQALKDEWTAQGVREDASIKWLNKPGRIDGTDCYIDLLFDQSPERIEVLKTLQPALIIVNALNNGLPEDLVRINGWPGFLQRSIVEAHCSETQKTSAEAVFALFNKRPEWVADIPGFISPRVVSMIINEAYFALENEVSTKEEIDTAMKLGTNYPYGPFEWGRKIGLKKIVALLTHLSAEHPRYQPANLLKKESLSE